MSDGSLKQGLAVILAADAVGYSRLMALDMGDVIAKEDGSVYGDGVNIAYPVRAWRHAELTCSRQACDRSCRRRRPIRSPASLRSRCWPSTT